MSTTHILELEITDIDKNGRGIARTDDGLVVFISNTLVGERVRAQLTVRKKKWAEAKVIKILQPGKDRVAPPCPVYFKCGGCSLMHIDPALHKDILIDHIKNNFKKTAGETVEVRRFVSGAQYNYRNKAQFVFGTHGGSVALGYYRAGTHNIVPVTDCMLQFKEAAVFAETVLNWAEECGVPVYNELTHSGMLRHLLIRKSSVLLVVNGHKLPNEEKLVRALKDTGLEFSLHISQNTKKGNRVLGEGCTTLYGQSSISPLSFLQVNDEIARKLYGGVEEILSEIRPKHIIEAYAGIGLISNIAAKYAERVTAIEIVEEAVEDGKKTAAENVHFICADVSVALSGLSMQDSVLILDPPRAGVCQGVIEAILKNPPKHIIYISCNPSTLARDYALFKNRYGILTLDAYDMFPQTGHVETLTHLTLKNSSKH